MNAHATIIDPRDIRAYARVQMEEQIMAVCGRAADDPRKFREWLRALSEADLRQHYAIIMEGLCAS